MTRLRALAFAALISINAAGCMSHREERHTYSLDGAIDGATQARSIGERPIMQLQRVLVPDFLDTTDIQLRAGLHEIHESTSGRFAERLSLGIAHALRSDLAARLPVYTIGLSRSAEGPARQILVNVDAFDVWPNGRCVLVADWSILAVDRRTLLSADRATFSTAAATARAGVDAGDSAVVMTMAEAVRQLADRIAASAEALPLPLTVSPAQR